MAGYQARAAGIGLSVDNFFAEKIFNDFNNCYAKSLESTLFIDFRKVFALFQCPAQQGVKKALQAFVAVPSSQHMYFREI